MNQGDPGLPSPVETQAAGQLPSPIPGVTWTWRDLVLGIMAVLALLFVVSAAIVGPFLLEFGEDADETRLAEAASSGVWYVAIAAAVFLLVRRKGGGWPNLGLRPLQRSLRGGPPTRWAFAGAVAFAFLGALGAVWLYSLLISVADLGFLEPDRQIETDYYDNAAVIAALGISIVAGAPFAEELLFRGFFYAGLRRYMGVALAAVVSGSIFALAHQDVGLILPFTAVAVIFAVTYERTGSLLPSIGGHLLFNLLSFSILILVPDAR